MDFRFSEAEDAWRKEVRAFFKKEITPGYIKKLEREQGCANPHSEEIYLKLAAKGWLGLSWPKKYGGQERNYIEQAIFNEESAACGMPFGTTNVMNNTVQFLGGALLAFGTAEQKQHWLPLIASGQVRSCQGLSEPDAGSDLASVNLRAVEQDGYFVLNGTKIFNNAHNATHIFTVSRSDASGPKHQGISLFLVDLKSPGISISALFTANNHRRNEVSFVDVKVPRENLLGEKDRGWTALAAAMAFERSQATAFATLMLNFDGFVSFIKTHKAGGKPMSEIPAVRYALADLATEIKALYLMSYRVAWLQGQGSDVTAKDAPMVKLFRSEVEDHFANAAADILGPYGMLEEWGKHTSQLPMEGRLWSLIADGRCSQIGGGTSQIQLNIAAQRGLGLPRK